MNSVQRQERIKFLYYVAKMPTGIACDRAKARDELELLLDEEGFGFSHSREGKK